MKATTAKGLTIALILVAVCALIGYHLSYPIRLNRETLPNHIEEHYSQSHNLKTPPTVKLYDGISMGQKEYFLIELGEDLGSVTLEKGLNGRYRFTHLGYGDGNFLDGIVESGGRKYLLFGGREISSQIFKITVLINGRIYELYNENAQSHFLLYTEIDKHTEDKHVDRSHIRLYNEKGEDITALFNLSGGGIG